MKFRIGRIFTEFRSSKEQNNVFEVRELPNGNRQILIGLLGETLDSSLTFYLAVITRMMAGIRSNIVELSGRNLRRLLNDVGVAPNFSSKHQAVYQQVNPILMSRLLNAAWLGSTPRIVGFKNGLSKQIQEILTELRPDRLPIEIEFVIEKKSQGPFDFLIVLCKDERSVELIDLMRERSSNLSQPLMETRLPF